MASVEFVHEHCPVHSFQNSSWTMSLENVHCVHGHSNFHCVHGHSIRLKHLLPTESILQFYISHEGILQKKNMLHILLKGSPRLLFFSPDYTRDNPQPGCSTDLEPSVPLVKNKRMASTFT